MLRWNRTRGNGPNLGLIELGLARMVAAFMLLLVVGCTLEDGGAASGPDLPVSSVEKELHIDGDAMDLVPVGWMGAASNGTIAVLQRQDRTVRFFDSQGNDLGLVGGQGEGPGEFQRPVRAGWVGDTLWVSDTQLDRVTLLSPEPAFIRVHPPLQGARPKPEDKDRFPAYLMAFPYAIYPGGEMLISTLSEVEEVDDRPFDGPPLFRASQDGLIEAFVFEVPQDTESGVFVRYEGGSASGAVPFYPRPRWSAAPDGSRIGSLTTDLSGPEAGTFRVSVYDEWGEPVFSRAYPFTGISIPEGVVDSVLEARAERTRNTELKRVYQTDMKHRVPPVYPPVEAIVLGVDGRTRIGLYGGEEGEPWLVLDPQGEPLGQVTLPAGVRLWVADGDYIWGTERNDFDVESIVRYRLEGWS